MSMRPNPRDQYSDVQPGSVVFEILQHMKARGITAHEAAGLGVSKKGSLHSMIASLENMHGYDVRQLNMPPDHPRCVKVSGKKPTRVVYFVAGRHDWGHSKYESYVTPEGLAP